MNDLEKLYKILLSNNPSEEIKNNEDYIFDIIPELRLSKGFNQNSIWHIYDVYEHILHVIDNVDNNLISRMSALFHDIGKPYVYTEDENHQGHFYGHYNKSNEIFLDFAKRNNLDKEFTNIVSKLIVYHDKKVKNVNEFNIFNDKEIELLFDLKVSDLKAQNPEFHYLLNDLDNQKKILLK